MPIRKDYFSISPLNDNPLTSSAANQVSGGFSFKESNPIVKFSLPAVEKLLEVNSLVLSGQFLFKQSDTNQGFRNPNFGNIIKNNGADMTLETTVNYSNHGGVHNAIDKVVIQTKKTNTELVNIQNYGAYASLREAYTNNAEGYLWGNVSCRSLANGQHAHQINRRMNIIADTAEQALGTANNKQVGVPFSISLDIDMLNSQNIHLGQAFTNGLLLTLHLSPDSAFIHQRFRDIDITGQTNADIRETMYVLRNLKLEGRYVVPTPQELKAYNANLPLNSQLNLLNDLHADLDNNSYTPQLNAVKGFCNTYLDKDQVNNVKYQQNNFRLPVGFQNVEHKKDNLRFPFTYPLKAIPNWNISNPNGTALNPSNIVHKENTIGDVEMRKHFERALMNGGESMISSANLLRTKENLNQDYKDRTTDGTAAANGVGSNMFPELLGLGVDYTYGLGNTMAYMNRDYSNTVASGINTSNAVLPVDRRDKTELVNTFVKYNANLNLNSLVKTM